MRSRHSNELAVPCVKPRELVATEAPNRIRDHLNRKARYNPTRSLTALTSQLTQEYEDRFLVELVQNAYDAHRPGANDGRVYVRLDEAADGAVLYVANTGVPFRETNFDALTNVAQSSKPPGEGIGNKGVGFRSVLQVCESPEIYSCDPDDGSSSKFDGFCFGFATDSQIRDMVADETQYEIVKRDFSRYLLPVVVGPTDPLLRGFRTLGMVTVVRLPLSTPRALDLARTQVQHLLEPASPIALFLDRLALITVKHVGSDGKRTTSRVERHVSKIPTPIGGPILQWVETVGRRFLTASQPVSAADMRDVVSEAVSLGELDESWTEWDSDVRVSLAIPADDVAPSTEWPSTYTYLPMRVASPLYAHLHAPFQTKMARLDLNESSVLNAFLIETAGQLAAATVHLLTTTELRGLDTHTRRSAVVDLLCWDCDHIQHLETALRKLDLDLETSPLIPSRGPDGIGWGALDSVRVWNSSDLAVLTNSTLEEHAQLVDTSMGDQRLQRLRAVAGDLLSRDLEADDNEVAGWIEQVAESMHRASPGRWNRFLNDVASVFESRQPNVLQGRFILLDDKRRVRRAGPWDAGQSSSSEPTVFIPPLPASGGKNAHSEDDAELSSVPKNLQRAITFLHDDVKVRVRVGSTFKRTAVGELFRKGDLVEPFELAAVLSHLERLLQGKVSDTTYRQALSWVFTQERASRANISDLENLGLRVPAAAGWIPASQAVFSPGWRTARSSSLAALVQDAAGVSPSIQALGDGAILRPQAWPFRLKDVEAFRDFLARCGVRDGLFPVALRSRTAIRMNGNNFGASAIAPRFGLTHSRLWAQHVKDEWPGVLAGPYTPYTGDQELWVVPGQDAFDSLGPGAKDRLAAAILDTLAEWPKEAWTYSFRRRSSHHASKPDPQHWPSPARSFVERAAWFPMSDPGHRDERYFVPPSDGWTFDETASEMAPRFARLAPVDHRRRLASSRAAQDRLERAGLKTWNSPSSSGPRLVELAALVAGGQIPEAEVPSVRRAASRAWSDLVQLPHPMLPADPTLVVTHGSALGVLTLDASAPAAVFVHDTAPGLATQVLEASNLPILVSDPADGDRIAKLLSRSDGIRARRTSAVGAKVLLDGEELVASANCGRAFLDLFDPWLIRTMLAIIDIRSTRFVRVTDKVLHDAEARLRRMRLAVGYTIDLEVDGQVRSAIGRLADCVHVDDLEHPLLVLNGTDVDVPSWRAMEVLSDDLAELMGQAQVASEVRAAALTFQRSIGEWREPTDVELANVLRCRRETVTEVLRNLRSSSDHLRWLLAPFVRVLAGEEAAHRLVTETVGDLTELERLLADLLGDGQAPLLLASATRAESVDAIRRDLAIDLGELNQALAELSRPPLHFPDLHRAALESYLNDHRVELIGALRRRFLSSYNAHDDLSAYTAARDFRDIVPDPAWLDGYETPTDEMIEGLLRVWLDSKGRPPEPTVSLGPIDDIRATNSRLLEAALPRVSQLVEAWCTKRGSSTPDFWPEYEQVRAALGASGCLDFVALDEQTLLPWLATLGLWPTGMELTLDQAQLGLSDDDLSETFRRTLDEKRRRRRSELSFGEREFDTSMADELRQLIEAVSESVDDKFLQTRPAPTKLASIKPPLGRSRDSGTHPGGTPKSYGLGKSSQEQTAAIGLAGEVLAYRWLQRTYRETTPDSWVSANRTFLLGGHPGNDGLGYDFRIARKNETLCFEVKATSTEEWEFDIGESELRAARTARKDWYRIIFIRSVLDPAQRQLLVLPNPLEPEVATSFAQINQGMRLRFNPA